MTEDELLPLVEANDADAQFALGCMARDGQTRSVPAADAPYLFMMASDLGHAEALGALEALAATGAPTALHALGLALASRRDFRRSVDAMRRAADAGVEGAAESLGNLEEAVAALDALVSAAEAGDPGHQFMLAVDYLEGGGLAPKDPTIGAGWLRRAAEGGLAEAAKLLGLGHLRGEHGLSQDFAEAVSWLERAGAPDEQVALVLALVGDEQFGRLQAEHAPAERWAALRPLLELSGRAGNADAFVLLSAIAARGLAGAVDLEAAHDLAFKGAVLGSANAKGLLAGMLVDGAGTAVDLPGAASLLTQAAEAGAAFPAVATKLGLALQATGDAAGAATWLGRAVEAGSGEAAIAYADVLMAKGDDAGAATCYGMAHALGLLPVPATPIQRCGAAMCILDGEPAAEAEAQAVAWLREAAEAGLPVAQQQLSRLLFGGKHGVERDPAAGLVWVRKAADAGNPDACGRMATMAMKGDGMPRDVEAAVAYFEKAAEGGVRDAALALARLYEAGTDVPADLAQAADWYDRAFALGYKDGEFDAHRLRARLK